MTTEAKKHSILIVEDEVSLRNALGIKFTREGFLVSLAKDGETGLLIATEKQPELILLDMVMPKMDGMTMLKKLRQGSEWGKNVPIILLTNLGADDEERSREISKDASVYYLVKSNWAIGDLIEKVRDILSKKI